MTSRHTRHRWLVTAAVAIVMSLPIVALVIVNTVLSIFFAAPVETSDWDALRRQRAAAMGVTFDARSWREVRNDCSSSKCRPFVNPLEEFGPGRELLPVAPGPRRALLVGCNETGQWSFLTADGFGFNGNRDNQYRTRQKVVLIGDSFTQGACVQPGESLADRLRSKGHEVLNLGVGGHQPLGELAVLKEYMPSAETLVWVYFEGNDFALNEKNAAFLMKYLEPGFTQQLQSRTAETDQLFELAASERERESATTAVAPTSGRMWLVIRNWLSPSLSALAFVRGYLHRPDIDTDYGLFAKVIEQARTFARDERQTRNFVFVYLPTYERFAWRPRTHPQVEKFDRLRAEVRRIVEAQGWTFVDIVGKFEDQSDPLSLFPFRTHAHYTAAGYEVVFRAVEYELPAR